MLQQRSAQGSIQDTKEETINYAYRTRTGFTNEMLFGLDLEETQKACFFIYKTGVQVKVV